MNASSPTDECATSVSQSPCSWSLFAANIDGSHVDFAVLTAGGVCQFVTITEYGKLGTIVQVARDSAAPQLPAAEIFTTRVLLGEESDGVHATARYIAGSVRVGRQLLVSLALRCHSVEHVRRLVGHLTRQLHDNNSNNKKDNNNITSSALH